MHLTVIEQLKKAIDQFEVTRLLLQQCGYTIDDAIMEEDPMQRIDSGLYGFELDECICMMTCDERRCEEILTLQYALDSSERAIRVGVFCYSRFLGDAVVAVEFCGVSETWQIVSCADRHDISASAIQSLHAMFQLTPRESRRMDAHEAEAAIRRLIRFFQERKSR
ncbi:hypothetical protein GF380_06055 [Candidatus Uhrbacteria bacterium]|nr:hypothetical protein [Candidatus Uhrbacteria bacterium]